MLLHTSNPFIIPEFGFWKSIRGDENASRQVMVYVGAPIFDIFALFALRI